MNSRAGFFTLARMRRSSPRLLLFRSDFRASNRKCGGIENDRGLRGSDEQEIRVIRLIRVIRGFLPIVVWILAHALSGRGLAAEAPWADQTLPVRAGLELWFDAARENEAREAHYMNRLPSGGRMELWHDSSGHARHAAQWVAEARPIFHAGPEGNWVGFDGADFLAALVTPGVEWKAETVFIVARPEEANGDYDGLFSATRRGESDYTSGLNVDLGTLAGGEWRAVNVEGAGQRGARNLLAKPLPLGAWRTLCVSSAPGTGGTRLRVDGAAQGERDRGDVATAMDLFSLGARMVGTPPAVKHFFTGGLAEVIVFGRKLTDGEIGQVESWLARKHAALFKAPPADPIAAAADGPVVRMLVPGFTMRELPVQLTNLNNLEYAPDGRLFAGGYDGRFHLLRDTDGDGLEDKVDTFSGDTSGNYPLGMVVKDGAIYAILTDELVRFRDANGDGVPDTRETVAKGWDDPALIGNKLLNHRRVDSSLALAVGPDGAFYTTMGNAAFNNGYWQDNKDPNAPPGYTTDKRRGCLLRISPDGKVEQLASGLRYIMSLQFNAHGDLFATDQEGATWLPNGNPFDELLHLQSGRHYGFPPQHPKLLPNVVDEPSVWDYTPQHQSTCGFRFNGPEAGRARFGPESWAHDAIVTGESRGKLWRTSLAKTAAGYVAKTQLFATLGMLAVDCAISPQGDLVVCCHSGPPDWGKGPPANGRIFKISYTDPAAPQPLLAYAASPTETVVQFNRTLDTAAWKEVAAKVEYGRFVSAADRFEVIRPGYQVVNQIQQREPRSSLPVKTVRLGGDMRSVIVETAPRTVALNFALTLDKLDLAHDLAGIDTEWTGSGSKWRGWLPHADFTAARDFTRGSATHDALWQHIASPGALKLRAQLDLWQMLQPAIQPGAKLDYERAPETVTVLFKSDGALSLDAPGSKIERVSANESRLTVIARESAWTPLALTLATPARTLDVHFFTDRDPRPRALGIRRFLLPLATPPAPLVGTREIAEIQGGDWAKGRELFNTKAACATCHTIRGEGARVGPDLSNLASRDYASVLKDIEDPSATINPDAVGYIITLREGTAVIGTRVGETADELQIAQPGGVIATLKKSTIAKTEPMPASLMPAGLFQALTPTERKDLMTFLLSTPANK